MKENDFIDFMMKTLEQEIDPSNEEIEKTWVQIGKLSVEDSAFRKAFTARAIEERREADVFLKKLKLMKAKFELEREEFWNRLYKTYGLPGGNYHIAEDGRIFMKPKK